MLDEPEQCVSQTLWDIVLIQAIIELVDVRCSRLIANESPCRTHGNYVAWEDRFACVPLIDFGSDASNEI